MKKEALMPNKMLILTTLDMTIIFEVAEVVGAK
jgi:hypothetical protein